VRLVAVPLPLLIPPHPALPVPPAHWLYASSACLSSSSSSSPDSVNTFNTCRGGGGGGHTANTHGNVTDQQCSRPTATASQLWHTQKVPRICLDAAVLPVKHVHES
jgi:hypothetical protein